MLVGVAEGPKDTIKTYTTVNRGMQSDEWANLCIGNIISYANSSAPALKFQVKMFKNNIHKVITYYLELTIQSVYERTERELRKDGYRHEADVIKGLGRRFKLPKEALTKEGYLTPEDFAFICSNKIIEISDTAPENVKQQAYDFKEKMYEYLLHYMNRASRSAHVTISAQLCLQNYLEVHEEIKKLGKIESLY